MRMDAGLDTGPIYVQFQCDITPEDTTNTLLHKMADKAAEELPDFLVALEKQLIAPVPQNDMHASEAHKIRKEEGCIHWKESAEHIERMIRAFDPWPGVHSFYQGERIRFLSAQVLPLTSGKPGEILRFEADGLDIACGKDLLRVQALQMPGKNPLPISALVNGYHDFFALGDFFVETMN
jgi:methionyl-tRNA formyltransferase